jgi:WD repeat-containing protein 81
VAACNLTNSLHEARKKYASSATQPMGRELQKKPWLPHLRSLIKSLYPIAVVISERDTGSFDDEEAEEDCLPIEPNCLVKLQLVVIEKQWVYLFFDHEEHTLSSVTRFSPAFLTGNSFKQLFFVFQLVKIFQEFNRRNLSPGDVNLRDFAVTENLQVQLLPDFAQLLSCSAERQTSCIHALTPVSGPVAAATPASHTTVANSTVAPDTIDASDTTSESFCDKVQGWIAGSVSNLDYLLYLNRLTGRRFGDPNFHPVLPWVTDFSSDSPSSLRDLTKSKFRLNKGDEALDRTYESGDHHVTAVLSEITYYTYMARMTDRSILCKYVRPIWVPEEYPRSIQRLEQWSPDESIPEFYLSPEVFRSIHADLPDLELPSWTPTPEGNKILVLVQK